MSVVSPFPSTTRRVHNWNPREVEPDHGTLRRYRRPYGCHCDRCAAVQAAYYVRWKAGETRLVSAFGAQRRLLSLASIGWSMNMLDPHMGVSHNTLRRIVRGQVTEIHPLTGEAVREGFEWVAALARPPLSPAVHRTIVWARTRGGVPPLCWDPEVDLDDPRARPEAGIRRAGYDRNGHHLQVEDVEWLAVTGETLPGAARRLGVNENSIYRWADRQHQMDLYDRLVRNAGYVDESAHELHKERAETA